MKITKDLFRYSVYLYSWKKKKNLEFYIIKGPVSVLFALPNIKHLLERNICRLRTSAQEREEIRIKWQKYIFLEEWVTCDISYVPKLQIGNTPKNGVAKEWGVWSSKMPGHLRAISYVVNYPLSTWLHWDVSQNPLPSWYRVRVHQK